MNIVINMIDVLELPRIADKTIDPRLEEPVGILDIVPPLSEVKGSLETGCTPALLRAVISSLDKLRNYYASKGITMNVENYTEEMQKQFAGFKGAYTEKNPKFADAADKVLKSILGIVDPRISPAQKEANGEEERLTSARLQQELASQIFFDRNSNDDRLIEYIYTKTYVYDYLAKLIEGSVQNGKGISKEHLDKFSQWWNGVRAQLALMDFWKRQGYEIYCPTTKDQVDRWDVHSGVDFIAQYEDPANVDKRIVCVDSKSRIPHHDDRAIIHKFGSDDRRPLSYRLFDPMLARTLRTFKPARDSRGRELENNIFAATILVSPTESGRLNPTLPQREALKKFGRLSEYADDAIMNAIDNSKNRECRLFTKEYA